MRAWWIAGVVLVSTPALALEVVDLDGPSKNDLGEVSDWVDVARLDVARATSVPRVDCAGLVARLKGAPLVTASKSLGKRGKLVVRKPPQYQVSNAALKTLCAQAAQLQIALKDVGLFSTMIRDLGLFADTSRGPDAATFGLAQADKCDKAVEALTLGKVKASHPFVLKDDKGKVVVRTVGQLKPKLCDATRTAANRYTKKLEADKKAFEARVATSGLLADKLDWFRHYNGKVFLAGGEEPKDLKKLAAADVWFAYVKDTKPDKDGTFQFTVRRYTFAGAKLQSTTETLHRGGPSFEDTIGSVMK